MSSATRPESGDSQSRSPRSLIRFSFPIPLTLLFLVLPGCEAGEPTNPGAVASTVQDLTVAASTATTIRLTFTEVGNGRGGPARHEVHFSPGPVLGLEELRVELGTCAELPTGLEPGTSIECTAAGLEPDSDYEFQIVSFEMDGGPGTASGGKSNKARGKTQPDPDLPPPGAVTDLEVVDATENSVVLSFTEVDDGAGGPARYDVRFIESPMGWLWGTATVVDEGSCARPLQGREAGATLVCTVEGLEAGTTYDFRMVAYRGTIGGTVVYGELSVIATGTTASPGDPVVTSVSVSPATSTIPRDESVQLTATPLDASGNPLPDSPVVWTSSSPGVATVGTSGQVTGVAAGAATIRATSGEVWGEAAVTVTAPPPGDPVVTSVTVSPATATISRDESVQLTATPLDASGDPLPDAPVVWTSSSPGVATVGSSGQVTGVAAGTATIRATSGEVWGQAAVTVTVPPPPGSREPSGYSMITDRGFTALDDAGWRYNTSSYFTIVNDGGAPRSCCTVGQARYHAGRSGGSGPVTTWTTFSGRGNTELYVSFWLKLSSNWQGHSSGVNKILFAWIHGDASVYLSAQGSGSGTLRPQVRLQAVPDGSHNLAWNVNNVSIERGKWHHWEVQLVSNSGGEKNGVARLWIDGTLALDHRDVRYSSASQGRIWESLYWSPIWGGMGDTVQSDMFMWMDHLYASGR
jgi:hypothetical protein